MKSPLCEECIKSGVLCPDCNEKEAKGEISETDIRLARLLHKLEEKQVAKDTSFLRTIDTGDMVLVLTDGKVGNLVGRGGRVVRLLSKEFDKKVRIIKCHDSKTALQDLFAPARIIGINVLYTADGEKRKVIIPRSDRDKLVASLEALQRAAHAITGDSGIVIALE